MTVTSKRTQVIPMFSTYLPKRKPIRVQAFKKNHVFFRPPSDQSWRRRHVQRAISHQLPSAILQFVILTSLRKIHDANPPDLSETVYQRVAELEGVRDSLDELSAYIETVDAILDAYRSGGLTIEEGQVSFWARGHQLGPETKFSTAATASDKREEDVICMLDYAIKAQNEGGAALG